MAEVIVNHDAFAALLAEKGVEVAKNSYPFYTCMSCGCLFVPDIDYARVYPDRYIHAGPEGGVGCEMPCDCHDLPYTIDIEPSEPK